MYIDPTGHQQQPTQPNDTNVIRITVYGELEKLREQQLRDAALRSWDSFLNIVLSKEVSDFSAGIGDALTGRMIPGVNTSLTEYVRNQMASDGVVAKGSLSYGAGDLIGGTVGWTLAGSASATAAAIANGKSGRLFGRGTQTVFNSSRVRFGWGWEGPANTGRDVIRLGIGPARGTSWWSHIPFWHP